MVGAGYAPDVSCSASNSLRGSPLAAGGVSTERRTALRRLAVGEPVIRASHLVEDEGAQARNRGDDHADARHEEHRVACLVTPALPHPALRLLQLMSRLRKLSAENRIGGEAPREPDQARLALGPITRGDAGRQCCDQPLAELLVVREAVGIRRDGFERIARETAHSLVTSKHSSPFVGQKRVGGVRPLPRVLTRSALS